MHSDLNEKRSFYWIDYETWGSNPSKDRPCKFTGIRTDEDLNIIGEPLVIYCQLPSDYLPSPDACLLTGITPRVAMTHGLPEPEFMRRIHEELSKPNTCIVGYNNVKFDDEITRYGLYRNFIDPFDWSLSNGNSRWDLLDVLRACYALRPDGVNWSYDDDGLPSFELEELSAANGIEHGSVHDAKSKVISLIEIAKVIKNAQPKLFDFLFKHRLKKQLKSLIDITNNKPLVHISGIFGNLRGNTSWVIPIIEHPTNSSCIVTIDLALNPTSLFELSVDELRTALYNENTELSEDESAIPIKVIDLDECPVLATAKALTESDADRINLDRKQCLANFRTLKDSMPMLRNKFTELFSRDVEQPNNDHVDTQLYSRLFSSTDKIAINTIISTSPDRLASLDLTYDDERIPKLLFNYRARNFPHTLNENELFRWNNYRREYFESHGYRFMESIESLAMKYESDEKKVSILKQLVKYVQDLS